MKRSEPPPEALQGVPFTPAQAEALGVSRRRLGTSPLFRSVCRGVHVTADTPDSAELRLAALGLVIPRGAVLTGTTAAWVQAVDIRRSVDELLEVTDTRGGRPSSRGLLVARRAQLTEDDVTEIGGLLVTTLARTAFDLARRDVAEGVVALDAMWRAGLLTPEELLAFTAGKKGVRGIRQVATVASLADRGAQSPQESRLRMVLVLEAKLPRPETQLEVPDDFGGVLATLDIGYRGPKAGAEYDGKDHDTKRNRTRDARRHNRLKGAGWLVLQYGSEDLRLRRHVIRREMREALNR